MAMNLVPTILGIALVAHGVGHMLWLVSLLGMADWRQVTDSWLITPRFGCYVTQAVGTIIWLAAIGAFLAAAFGVFVGVPWWREAAVIGSIVSLLGLFLFWKNPPTQGVIAATIVDIALLVALLIFDWPTAAMIGA